jgi:hypothetical protein
VLAAARKQREASETAALVTEILAGRAPRPLPASINAALEQFDESRGATARLARRQR